MTAKIVNFPTNSSSSSTKVRQKMLLSILENGVQVYSVRCPRKGPLGAEISLLVCEADHRAKPENCSQQGCNCAQQYASQIATLKRIGGYSQSTD